MKVATREGLAIAALFFPCALLCENAKTYKHASEYKIAVLDQNLRVATGLDVTLGKNSTDAKLGPGGQGIHLLHTDAGDYRVEAPVNKGITILSAALESNRYTPAKTFHNKWFLDNVQPGTKVLFASECGRPNKKHPNEAVRCTFYFPDPDSSDHEYATIGDFTPFIIGDGSNTAKTAGTLCGTGKLKPDVESQLCQTQPSASGFTAIPSPAATAMPAAPAAPATTAPPQLPPPAPATVTAVPAAITPTAPVVAAAAPARDATAPSSVATWPTQTQATKPALVAAAPAPTVMPAVSVATGSETQVLSPGSITLVLASVAVDSSVKGAEIEVDGQFAGNTPSTITVIPGRHTIEVKKNGYAIWNRTLTVAGNGVHVSADLSPQLQTTTAQTNRTRRAPVRCYPASACGTGDAGSSSGETAK